MSIYDPADELPADLPGVRVGPVEVAYTWPALEFGPGLDLRPHCGRGHPERRMRVRENDAKCDACGYVEPREVTLNNEVNTKRWNEWAERAEVEFREKYDGEVVDFGRRPFPSLLPIGWGWRIDDARL